MEGIVIRQVLVGAGVLAGVPRSNGSSSHSGRGRDDAPRCDAAQRCATQRNATQRSDRGIAEGPAEGGR